MTDRAARRAGRTPDPAGWAIAAALCGLAAALHAGCLRAVRPHHDHHAKEGP